MEQNFLKPIRAQIFYNKELKKITKRDSEDMIVSEGLNFTRLLYFIFSSYPEIQKRFPLGKLGILLNGKRPEEYDILKDGDQISLSGIRDSQRGT